ncbi:hypothetical protein [Rubrivivax gelatinosus]|uniref:Uncharacterized protein n=1 Tax=Rubrivivax gelatinosus TaxID=28068 RepID=A0A4R2M8E8_RUBGE|nr:hypothetical protein [Rubrivivax gelatinosus]MBK1687428.1 hypothetical protein [Rubrivivax gelatinosus]TCP00524.1 hypothetical protein EV684_113155 [Rubrivivax gelatinosus]
MTAQRSTGWWRRLTRRADAAPRDVPDAADLGTCFGLEAVLQAEAEARALPCPAPQLPAAAPAPYPAA